VYHLGGFAAGCGVQDGKITFIAQLSIFTVTLVFFGSTITSQSFIVTLLV
jgi:hypothetical protein